MTRRPRNWIVFALAAASLAGCGGSSNRAFIAQADAICKRVNGELAAATPAGKSAKELIQVVPRHAALERGALNELARLAPPSALSGSWRAMLADRQKLADALVELGRAVGRNERATVERLTASKKRLHEAMRKAATSAGFKDCATIG